MEVVGRLSLVLLGMAIGLGAAEASLRLMARLHPAEDLRGLHEPRPDRPWLYGLRPGAEGRRLLGNGRSLEEGVDPVALGKGRRLARPGR